MSLNDKDTYLSGARGIDVHPGVANPTESSVQSDPLSTNFVCTACSGVDKNRADVVTDV